MAELAQTESAERRGDILSSLRQYFGSNMATTASLFRCLAAKGRAQSSETLQLHLVDLGQRGYVQIFRAMEMPGHNRTASLINSDSVMFVKLLPTGEQLVEGTERDPEVLLDRKQQLIGKNHHLKPSQPGDPLREAFVIWRKRRQSEDMETLIAAARQGDSLASDLVAAMALEALQNTHKQAEKRRPKRTLVRQHKPQEERYWILQTLGTGYRDYLALADSVLKTLVVNGFAKQQRQEEFELRLIELSARGYIQIYRAEDMPWYRGVPFLFADRPETIMFVKITPAGISLIEGTAAPSELRADL